MKFSVNKNALLKELNLLQGIVEKKSTIPILSNVLIETGDSKITLIATDLDVSLQTECVAEPTQPGSIVLQARKLCDIVKNLPEAEIYFIKEENDWVRIICAGSNFKMVGQAKEHFPSTPKSAKAGIVIPATVLYSLISRTVFAITQEESRYALNGALLQITDEGELQMVATDGHRLALAVSSTEKSLSKVEPLKVIVPKKALIELAKLTAGVDDNIELSRDENHLYFEIQNRNLTSRMLAGQFPNYELVLPKNNDKSITLNVDQLAQGIRRAALMADERSHGVKVEITNGKLSITSQSADVGEAKEEIPLDYAGESLSIGFNAQYLLDFLGVVGTDEVLFEFKDEMSPCLLRPTGESMLKYQYILMPVRL